MNVTHTDERMQAIEEIINLAQQPCGDECPSKYEIRAVLNRI